MRGFLVSVWVHRGIHKPEVGDDIKGVIGRHGLLKPCGQRGYLLGRLCDDVLETRWVTRDALLRRKFAFAFLRRRVGEIAVLRKTSADPVTLSALLRHDPYAMAAMCVRGLVG